MAQNTFINVTASKNAANIADKANHSHTSSGGGSASGDLTVSFDSAVVTNLNIWDSSVAAARIRAIAGGLK